MTTYANPTTAPAGTRVYTVRGGYGADGTRVYATVTGYVHGGESIGVRYDNGGTNVGPVSHKAWIVADDRAETPEGRVTIAVENAPEVAAAQTALTAAVAARSAAIRTRQDAQARAAADPTPENTATYYAADAAESVAYADVSTAEVAVIRARAAATRDAWQVEVATAQAAATKAAEVETFTCECGDAEHRVTPGDDDSLWCECGARLDVQRERVLDDMWAERAERAAGA